MKNISNFYDLSCFFLSSASTQKRIVKPISLGDFSVCQVQCLFCLSLHKKKKFAAEIHELVIQVQECYEFDTI